MNTDTPDITPKSDQIKKLNSLRNFIDTCHFSSAGNVGFAGYLARSRKLVLPTDVFQQFANLNLPITQCQLDQIIKVLRRTADRAVYDIALSSLTRTTPGEVQCGN